MSPHAVLVCDSFSDISCFAWSWQFWGIWVHCITKGPSIGISWYVFGTWLDLSILEKKDHGSKTPVSPHRIQSTSYWHTSSLWRSASITGHFFFSDCCHVGLLLTTSHGALCGRSQDVKPLLTDWGGELCLIPLRKDYYMHSFEILLCGRVIFADLLILYLLIYVYILWIIIQLYLTYSAIHLGPA